MTVQEKSYEMKLIYSKLLKASEKFISYIVKTASVNINIKETSACSAAFKAFFLR